MKKGGKLSIVFAVFLCVCCLAVTGCDMLQQTTLNQTNSGEQEGTTMHEDDKMMNEDESMMEEGESMMEEWESMKIPMTQAGKYVDVSPQIAKKIIDENSGLIIIDVSPVYADGHLPGAVGYYVGDGTLDKAIPSLDKNATYLVYCHIDSASISGAQKLVDAGFEKVYRLEGNYKAWTDAGYEIEK